MKAARRSSEQRTDHSRSHFTYGWTKTDGVIALSVERGVRCAWTEGFRNASLSPCIYALPERFGNAERMAGGERQRVKNRLGTKAARWESNPKGQIDSCYERVCRPFTLRK